MDRDDVKVLLGMGGGLVLAVVLFLGAILWLSNAASLPSSLAKIDQLRTDVGRVDPRSPAAAAILGQATQWNQTIESNRALNATWYAGWSIPDEWDRVPLIAIPNGG